MLLVDANISLELFLGQKKADECQPFLNKISSGELEADVSKFTIHTIEATLNNSAQILTFLRNLQGSLGLTIYETSIEDEIATSPLMNKVKLDFDDALHHHLAKKLGVKAIVS